MTASFVRGDAARLGFLADASVDARQVRSAIVQCLMGRKRYDPTRHFWSFVQVKDGCWDWLGATDKNGYGKFQYSLPSDARRQHHVRAHRYMWQLVNGPIPKGMVIAHTCDNPPCTRPDHLWLATPRENNDDKVAKDRAAPVWGTPLTNSRKTHCKRGHPLSGDNLYLAPKTGFRTCKTCRRNLGKERRRRRKGVEGR